MGGALIASPISENMEQRKLHIGGLNKKDGWEIFNTELGTGVDEAGNAIDLSVYADETFCEVYTSHVLEHFSRKSITKVLTEWRRVLEPGGVLYVAVPDLKVLFDLYLNGNLSTQNKIRVLHMVYGSQTDRYDYHKFGFEFEMLRGLLGTAGFCSVARTESFGLFNDCSEIQFEGKRISLNVIAIK